MGTVLCGRSCPVKTGSNPIRAGRIAVFRAAQAGVRFEGGNLEAEFLQVQIGCLLSGRRQVPLVFLASHSEIREMVEKSVQEVLAVFLVFLGVEDVVMPHCVHQYGRRQQGVRMGHR